MDANDIQAGELPADKSTARDRLSIRSGTIKPAATLLIAARAQRMRKEGIDVISFSTGEPDFDTPRPIAEAGIEAINSGFTHYTDSSGIPELRAAIAEKFTHENGIQTSADNVLVSSGGKHSIFNLAMSIIDPGDEVIIPSPYWVSYPSIVELCGGVPVLLETGVDRGFKITPEDLQRAITDRTRLFILNSPSNPTGRMYTEEEIRTFAEIARRHDIYILSDELYEKIVYGPVTHFSIGSIPEMRDLAITVNGVSKAWAMTGWRIGFCTGPIDVMRTAAAIQSQTTSNASSISQKAALKAVRDGADEARRLQQAFEQRKKLTGSLLRGIPNIRFCEPEGAFYYFIDISHYFSEDVPDSTALAEHLLVEGHLAVVPGIEFGDPDGIRISYACSDDDIREGLGRMERTLRNLDAR